MRNRERSFSTVLYFRKKWINAVWVINVLEMYEQILGGEVEFHKSVDMTEGASKAPIPKLAVRLIGLLFMTIGLILAGGAAKMHMDEKDALNWVPHTAQIEKARVKTISNDDSEKYRVDVIYQYEWGNKAYQGNRYRVHDNASSDFFETEKIVEGLLDAKQQTKNYPIYVNPNKPEVSAIKNEVDGEKKWGFSLMGPLFFLIGFFAVFFPQYFNQE